MTLADVGILFGEASLALVNKATKDPMKAQRKPLKRIISWNKNSELGKKLGLGEIKSIDEYQAKVPLSTYADYEPYVEYMIKNNRRTNRYTALRNMLCETIEETYETE